MTLFIILMVVLVLAGVLIVIADNSGDPLV